ncbi:hypothetical protein ACFOLJ_27875 [Rugamonas sp. CCM 8940]
MTPSSLAVNQPALDRYHFVEDGYDPPRNAAEIVYKITHFGVDSPNYIARRIANPASPQLVRLLNASNFAKTDPNATCGSSAQLFGEYLHAFEDTFAHRTKDNAPFTAEGFGWGTGHMLAGKNPDFTYNHLSDSTLGVGYWGTNESRTFEMETEVFSKLKAFGNPANMQESIATIKYTLDTFNRFDANDESGEKFNQKIKTLNDALAYLGYKDINIGHLDGKDRYLKVDAQYNRENSLIRLLPENYIGTILPGGTAPLPKK